MKTYTVQQIRKYIESCDSLGDVLYYCKEEYIDRANEPKEEESEEIDEDDTYSPDLENED